MTYIDVLQNKSLQSLTEHFHHELGETIRLSLQTEETENSPAEETPSTAVWYQNGITTVEENIFINIFIIIWKIT